MRGARTAGGSAPLRPPAPARSQAEGLLRSPALGQSGDKSGFTLLEILVSLLILTISVSSILALYAVGAASHQRGLENAAVGWVARQVASEIASGAVAPGRDRPAAGFGGRFKYDVELAPSGRPDVVKVVVTVRWSAEGRPRSHVFEQLILRPVR